jgi:hypothetical protein
MPATSSANPLADCCTKPLTGFYRDGSCNTGPEDLGLHTVCTKSRCRVSGVLESGRQRSVDPGARIRLPRPQAGRLLVSLRGALERGVRSRQGTQGQTDGNTRSDPGDRPPRGAEAPRDRSQLSACEGIPLLPILPSPQRKEHVKELTAQQSTSPRLRGEVGSGRAARVPGEGQAFSSICRCCAAAETPLTPTLSPQAGRGVSCGPRSPNRLLY